EIPAGWRGALIVDGLFGIGLARALSSEYAAMVEAANAAGVPILALDVPTGLDADTGVAQRAAIRAMATATFLALTPGLLPRADCDLWGTVSVHDLGIDINVAGASGHSLEWPVLALALPEVLRRRARNAHKGTVGTLAILGGAAGMYGAPLLAGRAALQMGAGKVWIGYVAADHPQVEDTQPELMLRSADHVMGAGASAMVCGPGLGTARAAAAILVRAIAEPVPLVLDADALNLIAASPDLAATVARRSAPPPTPPRRGRAIAAQIRSRSSGGPDRVSARDRNPAPRRGRSQRRGQRAGSSGRNLGHQYERQSRTRIRS